jgi:dihydrofolate reductase
MRLSLIVAMAKNRVIGSNNQMPWHLPADFAYFKRITMAHPVIMGRKTFESIGRPLPGRRNVVVSRNPVFRPDGVEVAASLEAAISACRGDDAFVIGGATLYAEALSTARVERIFLTEVDASPEGDTRFPQLDKSQWRELSRERRGADEKNVHAMEWVLLEKNDPMPIRSPISGTGAHSRLKTNGKPRQY